MIAPLRAIQSITSHDARRAEQAVRVMDFPDRSYLYAAPKEKEKTVRAKRSDGCEVTVDIDEMFSLELWVEYTAQDDYTIDEFGSHVIGGDLEIVRCSVSSVQVRLPDDEQRELNYPTEKHMPRLLSQYRDEIEHAAWKHFERETEYLCEGSTGE